MRLKHKYGMVKSADPDQTAPQENDIERFITSEIIFRKLYEFDMKKF